MANNAMGLPSAPAKWNKDNEEAYQDAAQRFQTLANARSLAIQRVQTALTNAGVEGFAVATVIMHADAIRDALQPFDSGNRMADPKE
jgi:hypothetical protein